MGHVALQQAKDVPKKSFCSVIVHPIRRFWPILVGIVLKNSQEQA
jgi:hypothetical protein